MSTPSFVKFYGALLDLSHPNRSIPTILLRPNKKYCVSANMGKKIRPEGWKMFLFYEMFLIELYRKTSGRMIVEAENSPQNCRSGVFCLWSAGYRTFLFWPK